MRWDNLRVDEEELRALPGYRDPAVVRTFDAPEALDTRFYEIRAKSALNRVPKQSRMPFRWTINPYRGCLHACTFCLQGNTPILMADGRVRAIGDLEVGDEIYGTKRDGDDRRYVKTRVLAHWSTVKRAYRVVLEDGTELVASGDHRFLSREGWKHVTEAEERPHLATDDTLMGTGRFAPPPDESEDYRRGYLCGLSHGGAHGGSLAPAELGPLRRARVYTAMAESWWAASVPHGATTAAHPLRGASGGAAAALAWPDVPSADWSKGFLAGSLDAEGGSTDGLLITNTDPEIVAWAAGCLRLLDFGFAMEPTDGRYSIRVLGGLSERLRFAHMVDPVAVPRLGIEGSAVEAASRLRVASIEPLGTELPMYDITTGTGDFIANGVVSHNCFARPTHRYLDFDAGRDFEREIVVKVNVPEVLRTELARPSWKHEHVALGTNTDPYQWVEGRYKLMAGIWEAFRDFANPCSVLTKSPLLLRDLPLLKQIAERTSVTASFSVPTLDEKAWRQTEPHTPHPRARLEAVAELNRAGIPCGVLIAPLMPGINDAREQVERILALAAEAGAVSVGGIALHLRGEVRDVFFDWLRSQRPDLVPRYESLYGRGAYAPPAERERLARLVRPGSRALPKRPAREAPAGRTAPPPPPQATLF